MNKFMRFIARIGNVGGTARFVANGYNTLSKNHTEQKDIFKKVIEIRFRVLSNKEQENKLYEEIENNRISNLSDLVLFILNVENNNFISGLSMVDFLETHQIVKEELLKKGIEGDLIGDVANSQVPLNNPFQF